LNQKSIQEVNSLALANYFVYINQKHGNRVITTEILASEGIEKRKINEIMLFWAHNSQISGQ